MSPERPDPSHVFRLTLGVPQEHPGFIDAERQSDGKTLVLDVGIFPSHTYRIDREGKVRDD